MVRQNGCIWYTRKYMLDYWTLLLPWNWKKVKTPSLSLLSKHCLLLKVVACCCKLSDFNGIETALAVAGAGRRYLKAIQKWSALSTKYISWVFERDDFIIRSIMWWINLSSFAIESYTIAIGFHFNRNRVLYWIFQRYEASRKGLKFELPFVLAIILNV